MADVPLGAFLSSGVDSTAVVAAAAATSRGPVSTFTVSFPEAGSADEGPAAARLASSLGCTHHELVVTEREALDAVPTLPAIYDEPFADPAALPTLLISRAARRSVTVCLSGDGGDELFGGYARYQRAARLARRVDMVPPVSAEGGRQCLDVVRHSIEERTNRCLERTAAQGRRRSWRWLGRVRRRLAALEHRRPVRSGRGASDHMGRVR